MAVDLAAFKKGVAEPKQSVERPMHQRIFLIYAEKGTGKSTIASRFPQPFFMDNEDRLKDVRLPDGSTPPSVQLMDWKGNMDYAQFFAANPPEKTGVQTIVVDGMRTAYKYMVDTILKKYKVDGINDGALGYGKGKEIVTREFEAWFLNLRKAVLSGYGVVLTAHDRILPFTHNNVEFDKKVPFISGGKDEFGWEAIRPFPDMVIYGAKEQGPNGLQHVAYLKGSPLIEASSSDPSTHRLPQKIPFTYASLEEAWNTKPDGTPS